MPTPAAPESLIKLAEASRSLLSLGANATAVTKLARPIKRKAGETGSTGHTFTLPSNEAVAIHRPSALRQMYIMTVDCPANSRTGRCVLTPKISAHGGRLNVSPPHTAKNRPAGSSLCAARGQKTTVSGLAHPPAHSLGAGHGHKAGANGFGSVAPGRQRLPGSLRSPQRGQRSNAWWQTVAGPPRLGHLWFPAPSWSRA